MSRTRTACLIHGEPLSLPSFLSARTSTAFGLGSTCLTRMTLVGWIGVELILQPKRQAGGIIMMEMRTEKKQYVLGLADRN